MPSLTLPTAEALRGPNQAQALDTIEENLESLRATFRDVKDNEASLSEALELSAGLWRFWYARRHLVEGCRLLGGLLDMTYAWASRQSQALHRGFQIKWAAALAAAGRLETLRGDFGRADVLLREALDINHRVRCQSGVFVSARNLAIVAFREGRLRWCEELLNQSLSAAKAARMPTYSVKLYLGAVARRQKDPRLAERLWRQALGSALRRGDRWIVAELHRALGELAINEQRLDTAAAYLRLALTIYCELEESAGCAMTLESLAALADMEGNPERAARLAGAAAALRNAAEATLTPLRQADLMGVVSRGKQQLGERVAAAAWAEGAAMDLHAAVEYGTHPTASESLHERGDARAEAPALATPSEPARLTERELEIGALLRRGWRNRRIAEALVISPGTVKRHLENMLRKTGASTRTELALKLTSGVPG